MRTGRTSAGQHGPKGVGAEHLANMVLAFARRVLANQDVAPSAPDRAQRRRLSGLVQQVKSPSFIRETFRFAYGSARVSPLARGRADEVALPALHEVRKRSSTLEDCLRRHVKGQHFFQSGKRGMNSPCSAIDSSPPTQWRNTLTSAFTCTPCAYAATLDWRSMPHSWNTGQMCAYSSSRHVQFIRAW